MRTSRKLALTLALAGAALPAFGQDRPESILPPGFGEPQSAPTPTPRPSATAAPVAAAPRSDVPVPVPLPSASPSATPTPVPLDPATLAFYELPPFARHDPATLGPVRAGGFAVDAFGDADGQYVETLMRRLSAPLPSRWLSITLRRLLVAELDAPRRTDGADFAAERAWLLLRMGEPVAARAVVQEVDLADYTPKLFEVSLNALLAAGDPAGLCPLAHAGIGATGERGWMVAQAMCAGLGGDPARAQALLRDARRRGTAAGIDLLLAQKVTGAGAAGRESVTIEWAGVDRLTPWRFGLATATGVALPDELIAAAGPQVRYWQALSPGILPAARLPAAEAAAAQGVLSSAALVDLYAQLLAEEDTASGIVGTAQNLQTAYADRNASERLAALKRIWGAGTPPYARLVLTARAAARLPVRPGLAEADRLVASMLTAGLDRPALRWSGAVAANGDAWALLALADPAGRRLSYGEVSGFAGAGDALRKRALFFAGAAGLGRLDAADIERGAQALDVRIGAANSWTRALDRAVADAQPGTVVLLAAIGMQTAGWRGIPPATLYRAVAALRQVGLEGEARMIAAEALARS